MPSVIKVDQIQSDTGTVNLTSNIAFSGSASTMQIGNALYLANTNNFALQFQPDVAGRLRIASSVSSFGDNNPFLIERPSSVGIQNDAITIRSGGVVDLGKGQLKFPASQNASTDPNTLDDYEEGTCNIFLTDLTNNTSTSTQSYIKIGKFVTVAVSIYNLSISGLTAGSHIYLAGMPFSQDATGLNPHDILSSPLLSLPVILAHRDTAGRAALYVSQSGDRVNWGTLTRTVWGGNNISLYGNICYYANA